MDLERLDKIKVNFITGPGRSGTTLLVYVLNQSEQCVATPEIKHLLFFYARYKDITEVTVKLVADLKKYLRFIKGAKQFSLSDVEEKTWIDELKPGMRINYARLSKLFYLSLIDGKGDMDTISCIVDKNPYYTFYIDKILTVFPDARFVVMLRDHRAFVLSNRQSQKHHVRILSVFYYAAVWNLYLQKILAAREKYGTAIHLVRYEDLAENKEKVIEEICNFLGVDYSPALFDFYKSVSERLVKKNISIDHIARATKKLKDLSSPINVSRVNSWKTQLTADDIAKADLICSQTAPKVGYYPLAESKEFTKLLYRILSLPDLMRVKAFMVLDSPRLNYLINLSSARKSKKLLENN
ncbi:MAG TPA: sulfotransferase [Bacteroidia bacterium]|jgi:hypothetical protein